MRAPERTESIKRRLPVQHPINYVQHPFVIIVRRFIAGHRLNVRSGIGHREAIPCLAQHLHVVTAVAKGHHFTVLNAPARLQDPQAVSFVYAGDNQVDTAVSRGHRHHDVAKLLMQQRLNARNFVVRDV